MGATPKNPFLFQNRKVGFFNVGFFVFFGLNLKNDIILILYFKSKDSATQYTYYYVFFKTSVSGEILASYIVNN